MVPSAGTDCKLSAINKRVSLIYTYGAIHLRTNLVSKSIVLPKRHILTSRGGHIVRTATCKLILAPALRLEFSFFTVICVALVSKVMHLNPLAFHLNSRLSHCDIINNLEKYWGMDLNMSAFMKLLYLLIKFQARNQAPWWYGPRQIQLEGNWILK